MERPGYEGFPGDVWDIVGQVEGRLNLIEKSYYRQNSGKVDELIFDYDKVSLLDIVQVATREFPLIPAIDLIFPAPHGFGNYYDRYESPIVLAPKRCDVFREHDDSFECNVCSLISLADLITLSHQKTADLSKVKVGWLKGQMFLSINKK